MENKKKIYPISELKKFKDKDISEINIVYEDGDSDYFYSESLDILKVDKDGNFYLSDYCYGIIAFDKEEGSYFLYYHHHPRKLNITGYYDLELK